MDTDRDLFYATFSENCKIEFKDRPPDNSTYHFHNQFEVCYLLDGPVQFKIEDKTYSCNKNTILLFNNKDLHKCEASPNQNIKRYVLFFNPEYVERFSSPQFDLLSCFLYRPNVDSQVLVLKPEMIHRFEYAIKDLYDAYSNCYPYGNELMIEILLARLLVVINNIYWEIHDINPMEWKSYYSAVFSSMLYIHKNIDRSLTVSELAKKSHTSVRKFSEAFQKITGMTPKKYIIRCRIQEAKALLQADFSVDDVCTLVGFNDLSNFSRTFKNYVGVSPKKFAKKK